MKRMFVVGLGVLAFGLMAGCASSTEEEETDGLDQGDGQALSQAECNPKADDAKKAKVAACGKTYNDAKAAAATCKSKAENDFKAFKDQLKAAAPADAAVQAGIQKCLDGTACRARQTIAELTGKPVSEVEGQGFACAFSEWLSGLSASCSSIDGVDIGSAEYKALYAQLPAKEQAFKQGLQKCGATLDAAKVAGNECVSEDAPKLRDSVYSACRAECKVEKGKSCVPEGETVACGTSGDKRQGFLWQDKGCVCNATAVCSQYKALDRQLKADEAKDDNYCRLADGQAGLKRPEIQLDAKGAPKGVKEVCKSIK